jgi:glycosyltransferase involved in cell wall biosynthesis
MKVSIIIPAYNSQFTIKKSVESAVNQSYSKNDLEVIVVDDGSSDGTLKMLEDFGERISVISQKNSGAVNAANTGFKKARGEYLIKLDSDDYFEKNIIEEMVPILDTHQSIDFVYCDYYERSIDGEKKNIHIGDNLFNTIAGGMMFRKNKFEEEGFYDENFRFAEYDLLLKTLGRWSGFYVKKPLFWYVRRRESVTGSKEWVEGGLDELKKKYPEKIKEIKKIRNY